MKIGLSVLFVLNKITEELNTETAAMLRGGGASRPCWEDSCFKYMALTSSLTSASLLGHIYLVLT